MFLAGDMFCMFSMPTKIVKSFLLLSPVTTGSNAVLIAIVYQGAEKSQNTMLLLTLD